MPPRGPELSCPTSSIDARGKVQWERQLCADPCGEPIQPPLECRAGGHSLFPGCAATFAPMSFTGYWKAAREPRYAITFAFPLLLLYEGLSLLLTHSAVSGVRNGADVLLKTIFLGFGGRRGLVVFGA